MPSEKINTDAGEIEAMPILMSVDHTGEMENQAKTLYWLNNNTQHLGPIGQQHPW